MLTVHHTAGITYRSKCLTEPKAQRFARCLEANARFSDITLCRSNRAKSDTCWFVSFRPVSEERQAQMFSKQQMSREERALTEGSAYVWALDKDAGRAFWWLMSASGEVYELDLRGRSCSCPDYVYRCQGNGLECKHSQALRHGLGAFADFEPVPEPRQPRQPREPSPIPADAITELDAHFDGLDAYDHWARCGKCGSLTEPRELDHFRGHCANCWVGIDDACARIG